MRQSQMKWQREEIEREEKKVIIRGFVQVRKRS